MKILYVNNFKGVDYLNDLIFHGGRKLFGENLIESNHAYYMYDNLNPNDRNQLYGHGFTVTSNLAMINIDRNNLSEKISDHYFDLIFYGSIHRDNTYLDLVLKSYKKNEIIFLDGEDELDVIEPLTHKGIYFKREMIEYNYKNPTIPISFAFPEELLIVEEPKKEQLLAKLTTAENGYLFYDQNEYYNEFKKSYFALTKKKAGWDCMRHYEIILNGALPLMKDFHELPKLTMVHWDRNLLKESIELFWSYRMENRQDNYYNEIRSKFIEHAKKDLTTKAMFNYILEKI
jgi:hypothetical protein